MSIRATLLVAVTLALRQPVSAAPAVAGAAPTHSSEVGCASADNKVMQLDGSVVATPDERRQAVEAYGKLPLAFEAASGRYPGADFLVRGNAYSLWLAAGEAVLALASAKKGISADERPAREARTLRMRLEGGNAGARASAEERLPGVVNYYGGRDPAGWRTHVPTFARVRYTSVYPGVDLVYYGTQRQLEYDFIVSAGAEPSAIGLRFEGAESVALDADGSLVLSLGGQALRWKAPVMYQTIGAQRVPVAGAYRLQATNTAGDGAASTPAVGFSVEAYDRSAPLVIDPVLSYSTFLGDSGYDDAASVAVDDAGRAFVAGETTSAAFPLANPWNATLRGSHDAFIAKLDVTGSTLVYSTYLGGSDNERAFGIALDLSNDVYVTGVTSSDDFPVSTGAYDVSYNGGQDVFVAKLDRDGVLVYATYVGGEEIEQGEDIAVDAQGRAYVAGWTLSPGFPTTAGAYDTTYNVCPYGGGDAFVFRLNPAGSALGYSTFLGGDSDDSAYGIALNGNEAYVVGYTISSNFPTKLGYQMAPGNGGDAFVTRLAGDGKSLVASTFVGSSGSDSATAVALGDAGAVYITGWTNSVDYPTTAGAYDTTQNGNLDVHVTKLDAALAHLIYATFVGGDGFESGQAIAVNTFGAALVTGYTESANFPTVDPAQAAFGGGTQDAFVLRVNPAGTALNFSTYLGGSGYDDGHGIALDGCGRPLVVGVAGDGFPSTAGAFDSTWNGPSGDAFVTKIQP